MGCESFGLSCWGWHWGKWNPQLCPTTRAEESGGGKLDLGISISSITKCMAVLKPCEARKHNSLGPGGEESAAFCQGWLSQQPGPRHTRLGFGADTPCGVPGSG